MLETRAVHCPHCRETNEFNKETLDTQDNVACQNCGVVLEVGISKEEDRIEKFVESLKESSPPDVEPEIIEISAKASLVGRAATPQVLQSYLRRIAYELWQQDLREFPESDIEARWSRVHGRFSQICSNTMTNAGQWLANVSGYMRHMETKPPDPIPIAALDPQPGSPLADLTSESPPPGSSSPGTPEPEDDDVSSP